jgi:hypothetical protein
MLRHVIPGDAGLLPLLHAGLVMREMERKNLVLVTKEATCTTLVSGYEWPLNQASVCTTTFVFPNEWECHRCFYYIQSHLWLSILAKEKNLEVDEAKSVYSLFFGHKGFFKEEPLY